MHTVTTFLCNIKSSLYYCFLGLGRFCLSLLLSRRVDMLHWFCSDANDWILFLWINPDILWVFSGKLFSRKREYAAIPIISEFKTSWLTTSGIVSFVRMLWRFLKNVAEKGFHFYEWYQWCPGCFLATLCRSSIRMIPILFVVILKWTGHFPVKIGNS